MSALGRWAVRLGLAAIGVVALQSLRFRRRIDRRVDSLLAAAESLDHGTFEPAGDDSLPAPVRRYFETVLNDRQAPVRSVRLEQRGEFRLGDRTSAWKPMRATQHYTIDPPGFLWVADIDLLPRLPVRVLDSYERGQGQLQARVLSTIPLAAARPDPGLNEGELQRYLGEAVWFPVALLPTAGVQWEAIDETSARATLEDGETSTSLVFHFDEDDLVERVSSETRYRQADDSYHPWTGYFTDYEIHDGLRIPTEATVEWNLPEGELPYWRARLTEIEYT
jgi:hypothetical protein